MEAETAMVRLRSALARMLEDFRREYGQPSVRMLAARSGVNRYFLTKLLNPLPKGESASLDLESVLKLFQFLLKQGASLASRESFLEIQKTLKDAFGFLMLSEHDVPDLQKKVDLFDPNIYFTLALASCRGGVPKKFIGELLGTSGMQALKKLREENLIREVRGGRIHLNVEDNYSSSLPLVLHHIPNYVRHYKIHRGGEGRNRLHALFESLNPTAFKKLFKLHHCFLKEVVQLISDPESAGDIPVFSVAFFDSFMEEIPAEITSPCDKKKGVNNMGSTEGEVEKVAENDEEGVWDPQAEIEALMESVGVKKP